MLLTIYAHIYSYPSGFVSWTLQFLLSQTIQKKSILLPCLGSDGSYLWFKGRQEKSVVGGVKYKILVIWNSAKWWSPFFLLSSYQEISLQTFMSLQDDSRGRKNTHNYSYSNSYLYKISERYPQVLFCIFSKQN